MQIKHSALASLALIASVQAQAITRITGSSSTSRGYVEALYNACAAHGGTINVYIRATAAPTVTTAYALGNNFTVECVGGTFDDTETEVRFDVSGGSLNAILFSPVGASEVGAANGGFLPASTSCTAVVASFALNYLNTNTTVNGTAAHLKACGASAVLESAKSVGGFMDVEPAIFQAQNVIVGDLLFANAYDSYVYPATFSQAFAVGVSAPLYTALQSAQGLSSGVGNTTPANQPSLSMAQLNALMNNVNGNQAKVLGASFLASGIPANTTLYYCRRPNTSGTQMAAEIYFLQAVLATGSLGGYGLAHGPSTGANLLTQTAGNMKFVLNSGTSDVKKCLNGTAGAPANSYAIGILSAENNPLDSANAGDTFRLVKVQGAFVSEGVNFASQTATAIAGQYNFVFESVVFDAELVKSGTPNPILDLINNTVKSGAGTRGVFLNLNTLTPETKFTRNGSSLNAYTSD